MSKLSRRVRLSFRIVLFSTQLLLFGQLACGAGFLPPGFKPLPLEVHALTGGNVVIRPGEVLQGGTIIIRDGFIKAVGKEIEVPADARTWDLKGCVIYAGFIDPYLVLEETNLPVTTAESEPSSTATFTSSGIS